MIRYLLVSFFLIAPLQAAKLQVVASFSILADIVKNIGGEHVEVSAIVGPNEDAHIFRPTPQTAKMLANADLVVINGKGFEGWIERLVEASGYKGDVIVAAQDVQPLKMEDAKVLDPHCWHSVPSVLWYIDRILAGLVSLDPDHEADYYQNFRDYKSRLVLLDMWIREQFEAIPEGDRKFITAHDAFQYFGESYGVQVLAPVGVTTEEEPCAKDVAALIRQIREEAIKVVFVENISNPRLITQIANETGAKLGGTLYSDALGVEEADTYIKLMRHNVENIVQGCRRQ
ncbi:MAG: metal ABC transporter solute-binding protein, Zn/Mn family [Alphaproteobacteria bacterium]